MGAKRNKRGGAKASHKVELPSGSGNTNPLLVRRGGRDIKKNAAKPPLMERTGWSSLLKAFGELTTPSAASPQTPLLTRRGFSCARNFIGKPTPQSIEIPACRIRFAVPPPSANRCTRSHLDDEYP